MGRSFDFAQDDGGYAKGRGDLSTAVEMTGIEAERELRYYGRSLHCADYVSCGRDDRGRVGMMTGLEMVRTICSLERQ